MMDIIGYNSFIIQYYLPVAIIIVEQAAIRTLDSHLVHVLYTLNKRTCTFHTLEIKLYIVSMLVAMAWG